MDLAALFTQPTRLTPAEQQAEALLSLENRLRYFEQSARTTSSNRAPLPPPPACDVLSLYSAPAALKV